jgi:hypothetical protein
VQALVVGSAERSDLVSVLALELGQELGQELE